MIRRTTLRSTTALALGALLAVPAPLAAQDAAAPEAPAETDPDAQVDPTLLAPAEEAAPAPDGEAVAEEAPAEEEVAEEEEAPVEEPAVADAPADEPVEEAPAAEAPPEEAPAEADPEAADVAEPEAEPEAAEVAEPAQDPAETDAAVEGAPDVEAAEATDQAPVEEPVEEPVAEEEAPAEAAEPRAGEEAPATAAEAQAEAVEDVAEEGGVAIAEDPEPLAEAEADAPEVDGAPGADTVDALDEESQTEALIEEVDGEGAEEAVDGEIASEPEPEPEVAAETIDAPEAETIEAPTAEAVPAEEAAPAADAVVEPMEVPQDDTAEGTAIANEARAAAAAEAGADDLADVEARTITEEDVRSSAQAFEEDDEEEGLSRFEQSVLAALGGVAVGALLNNGGRVVQSTGDRVVVEREGELRVLKDDDVLLRRPGTQVSSRTYDDGSTLTVAEREDGTRVSTIRAADGQVLRRTRTLADGTEIVLFDDTRAAAPVDVGSIQTVDRRSIEDRQLDDLRLALTEMRVPDLDRTFSLQQVRQLRAVRDLVPEVDLAAIQFDTGSAAIDPSEAEDLRDIGTTMAELIAENPGEVFLVEGHTDAVGSAASNLALSDRRAESVALALAEYFAVPPENMVAQGYGEADLLVRTEEAARENRRATVRRITPLLQGAALR